MSRKKKSRKAGKLADPHKPQREKKKVSARQEMGKALKKAKKRKGLSSGARNQEDVSASTSGGKGRGPKDQRLGSKKPVALVVENQVHHKPKPENKVKPTVAPVVLTPEQELEKLENDTRLQALLERSELGDTLTEKEQTWMDEKLDRFQELMQELGLDEEEDELDQLARSADWLNELKDS